jgi:hypothetical protein
MSTRDVLSVRKQPLLNETYGTKVVMPAFKLVCEKQEGRTALKGEELTFTASRLKSLEDSNAKIEFVINLDFYKDEYQNPAAGIFIRELDPNKNTISTMCFSVAHEKAKELFNTYQNDSMKDTFIKATDITTAWIANYLIGERPEFSESQRLSTMLVNLIHVTNGIKEKTILLRTD